MSGIFQVIDGASQLAFRAPGVPYPGPLPGIQSEYIDINTTNLYITALTPSVFINSGSGNDTLIALAGRNYLDGAGGNNVLVGGTGQDSFEVKVDGSVIDVFQNVHASDDILVTGLTPADFIVTTTTVNGVYGNALDISATSLRGGPTATLIIPGYSAADVASDRISVSFSPRGMIILANS